MNTEKLFDRWLALGERKEHVFPAVFGMMETAKEFGETEEKRKAAELFFECVQRAVEEQEKILALVEVKRKGKYEIV